jgi:predicted TIM-barrel fold metal-dependent hydrolase
LPSIKTFTLTLRAFGFFDYLQVTVKVAGAHKILFGSDGPLLHPGLELHKIRLLKLSPEDEALVLGGNAQRLLQL